MKSKQEDTLQKTFTLPLVILSFLGGLLLKCLRGAERFTKNGIDDRQLAIRIYYETTFCVHIK